MVWYARITDGGGFDDPPVGVHVSFLGVDFLSHHVVRPMLHGLQHLLVSPQTYFEQQELDLCGRVGAFLDQFVVEPLEEAPEDALRGRRLGRRRSRRRLGRLRAERRGPRAAKRRGHGEGQLDVGPVWWRKCMGRRR